VVFGDPIVFVLYLFPAVLCPCGRYLVFCRCEMYFFG
jgi:hypothetical protein